MKIRAPFSWIINHFTYMQTFIFICILFFISLIPIAYFWIITHRERIKLINEQLDELKEEKDLEQLFSEIQQHRLLTQRLILAKDDETQAIMKGLDNRISETIHEFMMQDQLTKGKYLYESSIWNKINPRNIEVRWQGLLEKIQTLPHNEIEPIHTNIIHDLLIQFSYLSDKVGISYFKEIENYAIIEGIFLRIPIIQENISQLSLLGERFILTEGKELSRERIVGLISYLESDLTYLSFDQSIKGFLNPDLVRTTLLKSLDVYRENIDYLVKLVKTHILAKDPSPLTLSRFQSYSEAALKSGYQLWDEGFQDLNYIFKTEKEHIAYRLWQVLLLTITLTGIAFLLGLVLTQSGTSRLSQLTQATDSFTNGNLSIRVPDENNDEIGRQAQAFNRMAQKLEGIINNLYELLGATTALAKGNLSARIQTRENDTEFDQVARSFNQMAETFEIIISRLQQISMMLTSSAGDIAAASKEQETIIVEQEATTREIAVAANKISSTAKEFANTMNEMSRVAEQTSELALTGKGSLNNMESIMSLLVDASGNIASKLAVLNEKAGNITSVITTITKVADQTNLLSLNASIEAEKAGEYGRSFAVIAREIRRLADQSAVATLDIEKIVNEIMSAVSTSVMGVEDFTQEIRKGFEQVRTVSGQLAKIIEQVQVFTARFELLNQGMQAQSTGAEQINEAISQLSKTAAQTSLSIHQFQKTIQELNNAANELRLHTPFFQSAQKTAGTTAATEANPLSLTPLAGESARQVKETLSNLNIATAKMKNLNLQFKPPFSKNKE